MNETERYSCGTYILDVNRRSFFCGSTPIKLKGIPFDVLVFLLRHHGRMLTKEQIFQEVWRNRPGTVYDPNLVERAISSVRAAVAGSPEFLDFLRVERGHGIAFDGPVEKLHPEAADGIVPQPRSKKLGYSVAAILLLGFVLFVLGWVYRPMPPDYGDPVPLTNSGDPKYAPLVVLKSSHRVFFTEFVNGQYQIAWLELGTRTTGKVLTEIPNPTVLAASNDEKSLLIRSIAGSFQDDAPLFIQPIAGGHAKALGIRAYDGQWAHDGTWIAITQDGALLRYDLQDRSLRTLFKPSGYVWWPRFSPSGEDLRFSLLDGDPQTNSLWELNLTSLRAKRISPEFVKWATAAAGTWTADGNDFLFQSGSGNGPYNLWWMPGRRTLLSFFVRPRRLTTGPINFRAPQPYANSSKLFARGQISRAAMTSIDLTTGSVDTLMPDKFAALASYSPDGEWVVYYSTNPEQALFKCTRSGTDRHLLIPNPTQSSMPQWSPDGARIVVSIRNPQEAWHLALISMTDGVREEFRFIRTNAISPSWRPDGNALVFGTIPQVEKDPEAIALYELDLTRREVSKLQGSTGMYMPAVSPNGQYIAALRAESNKLNIFDTRRSLWLPESADTTAYVTWLSDNSGVVFVNHDSQGLRIRRCRVPSMQVDTIQHLGTFKQFSTWIGLAPNGHFLIPRDLSTQEIYQLEAK
jgi:Tol biopolymer transport system component/DNA-binding winged helix-turn-helix (wHTH) protein